MEERRGRMAFWSVRVGASLAVPFTNAPRLLFYSRSVFCPLHVHPFA